MTQGLCIGDPQTPQGLRATHGRPTGYYGTGCTYAVNASSALYTSGAATISPVALMALSYPLLWCAAILQYVEEYGVQQ